MSAKEMFEELGYHEAYEHNNIITYHKEEHNPYILYGFEFVLNHEFISCYRKVGNKFNYGAVNLSLEELKAINKQIEELGWFNE